MPFIPFGLIKQKIKWNKEACTVTNLKHGAEIEIELSDTLEKKDGHACSDVVESMNDNKK